MTLAIVATIDSVQNSVIAFFVNHKDALVGRNVYGNSYQDIFLIVIIAVPGKTSVSLHFCKLIQWESECTPLARWKGGIISVIKSTHQSTLKFSVNSTCISGIFLWMQVY